MTAPTTTMPLPWRIEYRGESQDAYVVGNLAAAAESDLNEIMWVSTEQRPDGSWLALGGFSGDNHKSEDYWGSGPTEDDALRFLHGAALDPREGM